MNGSGKKTAVKMGLGIESSAPQGEATPRGPSRARELVERYLRNPRGLARTLVIGEALGVSSGSRRGPRAGGRRGF